MSRSVRERVAEPMNLDPAFLSQYRGITQSVGVATLAGRTIIAVTGGDRVTFLHSFVTNDIKKLAAGTGCEAFVTSAQGKTLGHVLVFSEADRLVLDTAPGQAETLIAHFQRYVITEEVEFMDLSRSMVDLLIAGPAAADVITKVAGQPPPNRLLSQMTANVAGHVVTIRPVEYTGSPSYFLQAALSEAEAVLSAFQSAGAVPCDDAAIETARLEAGVPLFGRDITSDNLPQEIGRDAQAISFVKGCYLGQETVARIDALGHVNRALVGLKFASDSIPPAGTELLAADKPIGQVTSATWSPLLRSPLALALLRRTSARPGTSVESAVGRAEVVGARGVTPDRRP
jgi:folate-binding protein YgfZ